MSNEKKVKFIGVANPERNQAMIGKRSSNAAGTHLDGRDRRARTRSASFDREIKYEES